MGGPQHPLPRPWAEQRTDKCPCHPSTADGVLVRDGRGVSSKGQVHPRTDRMASQVSWFQQQTLQRRVKRSLVIPNDPWFPKQWYMVSAHEGGRGLRLGGALLRCQSWSGRSLAWRLCTQPALWLDGLPGWA